MKSMIKRNYFVLFPPILFALLFVPFLGNSLCLDGWGENMKTMAFFTGGLDAFIRQPGLHPPLKALLSSIVFTLLGVNDVSINVMGLGLGVAGVVGLYFLAKKMFNPQVGMVSSMLLAVSPVYLSYGTHSFNDYMLTVFIIWALYLYVQRRVLLYVFFATAATMTKEPAVVLPLCVFTVEVLHNVQDLIRPKLSVILRTLLFAVPVASLVIWIWYVTLKEIPLFQENIFAPTRDKGILFTIVYNLITFNFFHDWAATHRLVLFYLNFNWVYWLIAMGGIVVELVRKNTKQAIKNLFLSNPISKTALTIMLFVLGYFFSVLSLQTLNAPRYNLPILPFLYMIVAWVFVRVIKRLPSYVFILLGFFIFIQLFYSVDPISRMLWGTKLTHGQRMYGFNYVEGSSDSIIYNLQYPLILRDRKIKLTSLAVKGSGPIQQSVMCNFVH